MGCGNSTPTPAAGMYFLDWQFLTSLEGAENQVNVGPQKSSD